MYAPVLITLQRTFFNLKKKLLIPPQQKPPGTILNWFFHQTFRHLLHFYHASIFSCLIDFLLLFIEFSGNFPRTFLLTRACEFFRVSLPSFPPSMPHKLSRIIEGLASFMLFNSGYWTGIEKTLRYFKECFASWMFQENKR